ncbi:hypothetical protein [Lysobacter sp. Root690]|uniref:hypothetical protein n=1 Tax=Lysobacter sp. Root690 TaxID=1736588 RepID=UPI0012FA5C7D|nr:hypothetical protein [Lysobacter sp. Root690]
MGEGVLAGSDCPPTYMYVGIARRTPWVRSASCPATSQASGRATAIACARTGPIARWVYNRRMDQQLIIKFWRKSLADETFLATIEDELKAVLGKTVELEGYDVSAKEINLFMLTADPRHSFRRAKDVLEAKGIHNGMSAAFRLVGGAKFTSIWPLRSTRKFTLP